MIRNLILFIPILAVVVTACQKLEDNLLTGEWQATEVREEGRIMDVEVAEIRLFLDGEENYTFKSTINYQEAGTYYVQSNLLHTLDTINQASTEKAMEIVTLTPDSLFIKMNEDGKERLLKMTKVKD